jgi:hypothetical protein
MIMHISPDDPSRAWESCSPPTGTTIPPPNNRAAAQIAYANNSSNSSADKGYGCKNHGLQ